jgi:hypothetical protein
MSNLLDNISLKDSEMEYEILNALMKNNKELQSAIDTKCLIMHSIRRSYYINNTILY